MLKTTRNQLYHCHVHGRPDHDLFLSYRVAIDAATVQSLKEVLVAVAKRRYGQPLAVFHDIDCLRDAKKWKDGFLGALPRSKVFVAVISQASLESMVQKAESDEEDNVLLEIKTALDLVESGVDISVMPLCVSSLVKDADKDVWIDFQPYRATIPDDSKFDTPRAVLKGLSDIQMFGIRPDQIYRRVYRLLNLLHPLQVNDGTRQVLDSLFCDSKFRFDPIHLDTLLKQLTLTGRAVISGMGGMGKSVLAIQLLHFMMGI
ncbi:uncharacterized protein BJ171DRAFT_582080 [Polychytrium aggregatum]|uniref:uncharacterized protein n=1 Tax=Polychytrium aggregatum TaxID=110093 RepID=UPI0022FDC7A7|nr:uncharacterized protein BJ171DRAFT_582080 [Polychytrium aggregatum]KAI9204517.1 hypothetical protein BJ171DRAFT_582080 [Polychytrium aggregatum]